MSHDSRFKTLAYNILKETEDNIVKDIEISEILQCSECKEKVLLIPFKAFTVLACGHVFHRVCIEKQLLVTRPNSCPFPDCGESVELIWNDSESFDRQDSTSSLVGRMSMMRTDSTLQAEEQAQEHAMDVVDETRDTQAEEPPKSTTKKRSNETTVTDSNKNKKSKVEDEDSEVLKKLIKELSNTTESSDSKERRVLHQEAVRQFADSRVFLDLYTKISDAEGQSENARHEVLKCYYYFGEEFEKRLNHYRSICQEHEAQKKVNDEVGDQIPKEVTRGAIRKKAKRAQKIYDFFFRISDDVSQRIACIERLKSFTATSISSLDLEKIKYVTSQVRSNITQS